MTRILIDRDGVLSDLLTPWLAAHNKDYPQHEIRIEDVVEYDISKICSRNNCPADIFSYLVDKTDVWEDMLPVENAIEVTTVWHYEGFDLTVATHTVGHACSFAGMNWLADYFGHITNIYQVTNSDMKAYIAADFFIDDKIETLELYQKHNPQAICILFDQPYNRENDTLIRARTWEEVDLLVRAGIKIREELGPTHSNYFMQRWYSVILAREPILWWRRNKN